MGPSCVCKEMSVSFGFRVIIIRDGNNQFLCIAHPEEHREITTLTLGSVFCFCFFYIQLPLAWSAPCIPGNALSPLHWVNSKRNQEWRGFCWATVPVKWITVHQGGDGGLEQELVKDEQEEKRTMCTRQQSGFADREAAPCLLRHEAGRGAMLSGSPSQSWNSAQSV